jgi:hypothetical protein
VVTSSNISLRRRPTCSCTGKGLPLPVVRDGPSPFAAGCFGGRFAPFTHCAFYVRAECLTYGPTHCNAQLRKSRPDTEPRRSGRWHLLLSKTGHSLDMSLAEKISPISPSCAALPVS